MRDWEERMKGYGANLVQEGLVVNLTPKDEDIDKCKDLGSELAG